MLTLNILPLCKARSIRKPFSFLANAGFTNSTAHQIASGKVMALRFSHLEKLCLVLDCTPNDILSWTPTEGQSTKHAIAALIPKGETGFEWVQDLKNLSLEKLRSLGEVVKAEISKDADQ